MIGRDDFKGDVVEKHRDLLAQTYPAFSDAEMESREERLKAILEARQLDALMVVEAGRGGTATGWITGWPVTAEAVTVLGADIPRTMFIQHFNHIPLARKIAWRTEVQWGRRSCVGEGAKLLAGKNAKRIGIIGRLWAAQRDELAATFELADLNAEYTKLRLIKSSEEIVWLELAAGLTDLGIAALEGARCGMTERDLGFLVESAFLPHGATSPLHYFLTTPMVGSDGAVPRQYPSTRKLAVGDSISTEISADFWGYTGQVLRTFFVGTEPTDAYRRMHDVADQALTNILGVVKPGAHASELIAASSVIEDAGYTTIDDVVHGYGGGYLPPVLGSQSRPTAHPTPDLILQENMCLVVQPNVVTKDWSAGVQTGHLIQVTADGNRPLQLYPRGFHIIG